MNSPRLPRSEQIDPQFDPETGQPSLALTQQAALQTPKGKNEALGQMNHEMAAKYGVTTGVGSLFNPIAPHVGTDAQGNQVDNPTHVALPYADPKTGKVATLPVPVPLFNQMKADFNDRYFALSPSAQPAGVAQPTTSQSAPAATVRMQSPTGVVQDVPSELADHYTKLGAVQVDQPQTSTRRTAGQAVTEAAQYLTNPTSIGLGMVNDPDIKSGGGVVPNIAT